MKLLGKKESWMDEDLKWLSPAENQGEPTKVEPRGATTQTLSPAKIGGVSLMYLFRRDTYLLAYLASGWPNPNEAICELA